TSCCRSVVIRMRSTSKRATCSPTPASRHAVGLPRPPRWSLSERLDVAVVGAGPAGAATAILLAEQGCRVSLLHTEPPGAASLGESLSGAGVALLARFRVWERFRAGPHRPVHARASAWGGDLVEQSAIFDPHGPAWLIDREAFHGVLRERCVEAGAQVLTARVTGCRAVQGAGWRLDLAGGAVLVARTVVDATGRSCWVTRAVGGHCEVHDRMVAMVARLAPAAPPDGTPVLIEATPTGWWYSAVIPSGALVALFVTEAAIADLDDVATAWRESLTAAPYTSVRLRGARGAAPPEIRSVTVQRGVVPASTACVAVGDAALGLDPLSAAGLRTGLETALEAARAVTATLDGDRSATAAYSDWARRLLDAHLAERVSYYDLEARWPTAPFWASRRLHHTT
ncbi:MAG: tryptophan 7-halogenase, partial [Pseudonocardiaceae bacterium]